MRWESLFEELAARFDALAAAERQAELADRVRAELGGVRLRDRMRAAVGESIRLECSGGFGLTGRLAHVGADWLLIEEPSGHESVVAMPALLTVAGIGRWVQPPPDSRTVPARLSWRAALRGLATDRVPIAVQLVAGRAVAGTIDRVGADYLDLAAHPAGEVRRPAAVREVLTIPLGAVVAVRNRRAV